MYKIINCQQDQNVKNIAKSAENTSLKVQVNHLRLNDTILAANSYPKMSVVMLFVIDKFCEQNLYEVLNW